MQDGFFSTASHGLGFGLGLVIWGLLAVWAAVAYFKIFCAAMLGHGNVRFAFFQRPDLAFVGSLALFFVWTTCQNFGREQPPVTPSVIAAGALFNLLIISAVFLFLQVRKIAPLHVFGLWKGWGQMGAIALTGGKLFLVMFPVYLFSAFLAKLALGGQADTQETVKYFAQVAQEGDHGQVALMLLFGVVVAPIAEELLFRGYFYGVLRRFCGFGWALGLTSLLFAVIHLNVAALLPLGILALCLTLAYEATGSLLAPILMHAAFNASTFAYLYTSVAGGTGGV